MKTRFLLLLSLVSSPALLHAQGGGPLQPPGPPADGVYRTAEEIEPRVPISEAGFVITEAGSYYLTGNINGVVGASGIEIQANHVTLDLNGFTLFGNADTLDGIRVTGALRNITIKNGNLNGWGEDGIDAELARSVRITKVRVINSGGRGVATGDQALLENTEALFSQGTNITAGFVSVLRNCLAASSFTGDGIVAGEQSVLESCRATSNTTGIGIDVSLNSILRTCVANNNDGLAGFRAVLGARFEGCEAAGNNNIGFNVGNSVLTGCLATGGNRGFNAGSSRFRDCRAEGCGTGFDLSSDNVLRDCSALDPVTTGFLVRGPRNRLQENQVGRNDAPTIPLIGIKAEGTGNLLLGNSVTAATTPFDIVGGNSVGPIETDAATATSPHANFDLTGP